MLISNQDIWPKADSISEAFSYSGDDCLYRDHNGNRVIADWEGSAFAKVVRASCDIHQYGLCSSTDLFPKGPNPYGTLVVKEPGEVEALLCSEFESRRWPASEKTNSASGTGYVLAAEGAFQTDNEHRPRSVVSGVPVPFFTSASSELMMDVVVNGALQWLPILSFSIDEALADQVKDFEVQNLSAPAILKSTFEDHVERTAPVCYQLNKMSFAANLPKGCLGIRIGKCYDRFHGRQCARVWLDSECKGLWYAPIEDRKSRWAWNWFGFMLNEPGTDQETTFSIDPTGGTPLWSVSEIVVLGLYLV